MIKTFEIMKTNSFIVKTTVNDKSCVKLLSLNFLKTIIIIVKHN